MVLRQAFSERDCRFHCVFWRAVAVASRAESRPAAREKAVVGSIKGGDSLCLFFWSRTY